MRIEVVNDCFIVFQFGHPGVPAECHVELERSLGRSPASQVRVLHHQITSKPEIASLRCAQVAFLIQFFLPKLASDMGVPMVFLTGA